MTAMTVIPRNMVRPAIVAGALALFVAGCGSTGSDSSSNTDASSGDLVSMSSVDGTSTISDSAGKTLYTASVEAGGHIKCVSPCTTFWQPLLATSAQAQEATSDLGEKFSVVERPDGKSQLAVGGLPLYTFAQEGPDQLAGNGFTDDFEGTHFVWSAAGTGGSTGSTPTNGGNGGYGY